MADKPFNLDDTAQTYEDRMVPSRLKHYQAPPDRNVSESDVAVANAALSRTEARIEEAERAIRACDQRCKPLHEKIAQVRARPAVMIEPDAAEVEALLADPNAEIDRDALAKANSAAKDDQDSRRHEIAVINAAIKRVEDEKAAAQARIATLRNERELEWDTFVRLARTYLVAEFEQRFVELRDRFLAPIEAMSDVQGVRDNTSSRLHPKAEVTIMEWSGSAWDDRTIFPTYPSHFERREILDRFRAALPAAGPEQ